MSTGSIPNGVNISQTQFQSVLNQINIIISSIQGGNLIATIVDCFNILVTCMSFVEGLSGLSGADKKTLVIFMLDSIQREVDNTWSGSQADEIIDIVIMISKGLAGINVSALKSLFSCCKC